MILTILLCIGFAVLVSFVFCCVLNSLVKKCKNEADNPQQAQKILNEKLMVFVSLVFISSGYSKLKDGDIPMGVWFAS